MAYIYRFSFGGVVSGLEKWGFYKYNDEWKLKVGYKLERSNLRMVQVSLVYFCCIMR